ncbi:similar to Saccharomyces cerevisiae YBR228W SLX1 Subunit of a complex, with Slx4p, that hydrolyzes 5' branches from duplex DNA in response to stalled or converging replication forks [Maudiozyma saulgeensis]|uniref:Similar to Saccharomyces cerevisiae YBR228W SLX1 Subunit of a complex, with Slx4p, that hydrolyzes 5' branches from duplex DNA in response to stalled or converging replication forks n=1 Tax=Maudiozyma saulgeensis TaxID=1789683 RepID=A0A1X7R0F5_9SACH|nr:similar to Saccharomyces cerevisiae YBR228W SLX1 Subunit of a complex, with Slx4p, that hydrolyzes 5' branches from duplex DNA in response to stalled or converging replication forks [Kazachstania saulgeensis]
MGEFAQFYCCYFLQSVEHRQSFYIGSSPNPPRRLRQHNGDLVKGGAYRTKRSGTRPWEMILIVYGFPNKIIALQFEHAWQHGYKTRFIKGEERIINKKNSGSAGRNIHYKLALIRQLLNHPFFKAMNLGVQFFNSNVTTLFEQNKFGISLDPCYENWNKINTSENALSLSRYDLKRLTVDDLSEISEQNKDLVSHFYNSSIKLDELRMKRYTERAMDGVLTCGLCFIMYNYTSEDESLKPLIAFCTNEDCDFLSEVSCLCRKFIAEEVDERDKNLVLIPRGGHCPKCNTLLEWTTVIKYSSMLKEISRK